MSKFESEKVLKSTIVYIGPNRRRVADTVEFADKSNYEYAYFKNRGAVCVLACTNDNKVLLIKTKEINVTHSSSYNTERSSSSETRGSLLDLNICSYFSNDSIF